jgi:hypothetical protein
MGDNVWLRFPLAKIRWMNVDTGQAIASDVAQVTA